MSNGIEHARETRARIGMGGPAMVEGGGLGVFKPEQIGPSAVQHGNGVIDILVDDEAQAVAAARHYLSFFHGPVAEFTAPPELALRDGVPENRLRVYDTRQVMAGVVDVGSLLELRVLPDDFKLYCGHEYTASNVKFALTVESDNPALQARAAEVARLRADNKPTIPVLLGDEKKSNVFLRADDPSVALKLHMKGAAAADVFGELRERKNKS